MLLDDDRDDVLLRLDRDDDTELADDAELRELVELLDDWLENEELERLDVELNDDTELND